MLHRRPQQSSYIAYAFNAPALMRFINNLACATEQSQVQVLAQVEVESRPVCGGRQKAIIRYTLPIKVKKSAPDYFRDIDSNNFVWPSERIYA